MWQYNDSYSWKLIDHKLRGRHLIRDRDQVIRSQTIYRSPKYKLFMKNPRYFSHNGQVTQTQIIYEKSKIFFTKWASHSARPVHILLATKPTLQLNDGHSSADQKQYRRVIGALRYLVVTRPDIVFAVNKLAQFMHQPSQLHWTSAKWVL